MRRPSDNIETDVFGKINIPGSINGCMDKRGNAIVVLACGIQVKDLGYDPKCLGTSQKPIGQTCVYFVEICEREHVHGEELTEGYRGGSQPGLRKAVVEKAASQPLSDNWLSGTSVPSTIFG